MKDVVVVLIIAVFFAMCVAYVRWCDHIIGPDPDVTDATDATDVADEETPADAAEVGS